MSLHLPVQLRQLRQLRLALAFAFAGPFWLVSSRAGAQVPVDTTGVTSSAELNAQRHFDRALEQYRAGQYGRALASLEDAAKLDPNGKDLFFNLALVHEKLGQLPRAIAALERFRELETDAAERERARLTIERLRGAEREVERPGAAGLASAPCPEPLRAPAAVVRPSPSPVLIGAASVAIVSLVVGAVFGAKALSDDVSDASTSDSLSVAQLRERGRRAAREALIADVAWGLAAASAGTFACLWILSPNDSTTRAAGINLRSYF